VNAIFSSANRARKNSRPGDCEGSDPYRDYFGSRARLRSKGYGFGFGCLPDSAASICREAVALSEGSGGMRDPQPLPGESLPATANFQKWSRDR
jgi:hypothetical protein